MKFSSPALALAAILPSFHAFAPGSGSARLNFNTLASDTHQIKITRSSLFAILEDEKTKSEEKKDITNESTESDADVEGLPWWWDLVWKLDVMKTSEPGTDCTFGDSANVLRTNIEQIYGGFESKDGCPLAEGDIADIADGTQFIGLQRYNNEYGSPYKLCFGPKSFLVISDPVQAKHVLKTANVQYDKGLLSGELEN